MRNPRRRRAVAPPAGSASGKTSQMTANRHDPTAAPAGFVSLVGAGPGDPGLLTRKAVDRLQRADLVLFDALVSNAVLQLAPRAQCFPVGKRAGRPSVSQDAINRVMVGAARRGRRVVRLKGGDPFVLGRGGEEALALRAAGIPFEVIPGVSAAVAAPALAGIPVTHRGLASGFLVVSGHAPDAYRPVLQCLPPGAVTVVVLMGLASRVDVASALADAGWATITPAAIVLAAGTSEQRTWLGTLGTLASAPVDGAGAAGTIVVGSVVALAGRIAASPSRPHLRVETWGGSEPPERRHASGRRDVAAPASAAAHAAAAFRRSPAGSAVSRAVERFPTRPISNLKTSRVRKARPPTSGDDRKLAGITLSPEAGERVG